MASIRERKGPTGKSYEISVSLGYDPNGKKLRKSTTYKPKTPESSPVKRRKEIEDFARDFENRVLSGNMVESDKINFAQFVEYWKKNYAEIKLTEHVKEDYYYKLDNIIIPEIGALKMANIKAVHINNMLRKLDDKKLSPATVRKYWAITSSVFHCAYKADYVKENPCARCDLNPIENNNDHECFDIQQASAFLEALTLDYHYIQKAHYTTDCHGKKHYVEAHRESYRISEQLIVFFNLSLFSGCRRGELIALTWEDIDFDNCTIAIYKSASKTKAHGQIIKMPKTKAGNRVISIPQNCIDMLKALKQSQREKFLQLGADVWKGHYGADFDKNFVFIQDNGLMMNLDTPTHSFKDILKNYNAEYAKNEEDKLPLIRLHDLRHTSATILLAQNTDIESVAKRLGHHRTSVTLNIYGHALKSKDQEASDKLESLLVKRDYLEVKHG